MKYFKWPRSNALLMMPGLKPAGDTVYTLPTWDISLRRCKVYRVLTQTRPGNKLLTQLFLPAPLFGTRFALSFKNNDSTCFCVKRVRARVGTLALFFCPHFTPSKTSSKLQETGHRHRSANGTTYPFSNIVPKGSADQALKHNQQGHPFEIICD